VKESLKEKMAAAKIFTNKEVSYEIQKVIGFASCVNTFMGGSRRFSIRRGHSGELCKSTEQFSADEYFLHGL